jgi:hypothetical protein
MAETSGGSETPNGSPDVMLTIGFGQSTSGYLYQQVLITIIRYIQDVHCVLLFC